MKRTKIFTNKNLVTANEVVNLFLKCGWGKKYSIQSTKEVFNDNSLVIFCKNGEGELIGLLRIVKDGKYSNIIDLVIRPDYQNKNIGSRMITEVKKYYNKTKIYIEELNESNNYFFVNRGFKLRNNINVSTPWFSKIFNY